MGRTGRSKTNAGRADTLKGMSLVHVSALLAVAGLLVATMLPGGDMASDVAKRNLTWERMHAVETAMKSFMVTNLRRPCPADGTLGVDDPGFGTEAANPGECIGGSPAANFADDGVTEAVAGMVPTRALMLPPEYALDGYGRRIMYIVDRRATLAGSAMLGQELACSDLQSVGRSGDIEIVTAAGASIVSERVMWALISYGRTGHGAFPMQGGSSRINASGGSTTSIPDDALQNAFVDGNFGTVFTGQLVVREPDPLGNYDTMVWYPDDTKNICCLGKGCTLGFNMALAGNSVDPAAGVNVAIGDINGDTLDDLVVGNAAAAGDPAVYVIWGARTGWPVGRMFDKDHLATVGGFIISNTGTPGGKSITGFGRTLAVGDVNGDSFDDIIIGGSYMTVLFGSPSLSGSIKTSSLAVPGSGTVIDYGYAASAPGEVAVGDISGDGTGDIVFSAGDATNTVWAVFGGDWSARTPDWDISAIPQADGFRMVTLDAATYPLGNRLFAMTIADVTNDGTGELIMGDATAASNDGIVYVFFGPMAGDAGTPSTLSVDATIFNGTTAMYLDSAGRDGLGVALAVGDLNSDGYRDIAAASDRRIYLYSGSKFAGPVAGFVDIDADADVKLQTATYKPSWISGDVPTVLRIADINQDGRQDLALGVQASAGGVAACGKNDPTGTTGSVYVLFQPSPPASGQFGWQTARLFSDSPDGLDSCNSNELNRSGFANGTCDGTACAFRIDGATKDDYAYLPITGDLNRDGRTDIVIAAPGYGGGQGGVFIVQGRKSVPWDSALDLQDLDFDLAP